MEFTMYHVTPVSRLRSILRKGLVPAMESRGIYADSSEKRSYLFEDPDTAEDGLVNWMWERSPRVRTWAILEVQLPNSIEPHDDPEVAGSWYVRKTIPPDRISVLKKIEV